MLFTIVQLAPSCTLSLFFPLSLTHSFHLLHPVHFFLGEYCEGRELSVFNSLRPYSTQCGFSPLNTAHNKDAAHQRLPCSLSLFKHSLHLNAGSRLKSQRPRQGLLSSPRPAILWYSGSSSHLSKPCTPLRLPVGVFSGWGSRCVINMWFRTTAETKTRLRLCTACFRHKCGFFISWLVVMNDLFCFFRTSNNNQTSRLSI